MVDLRHEVHILIAIAKLDSSLYKLRAELNLVPGKREFCNKAMADAERAEKEALEHFEAMKKERQKLERSLEDNAVLIRKYKNQLMAIKTNKEYTALLKEISNIEKDTDEKEEKLLILMDEVDEQQKINRTFSEKVAAEREKLRKEKTELEAREKFLQGEIAKLEREKQAALTELNDQVRKRYGRILTKLGDFAVTNVSDEVCQGCFSRIPPQTAHEVEKNDRIVTCEACGRILVHY